MTSRICSVDKLVLYQCARLAAAIDTARVLKLAWQVHVAQDSLAPTHMVFEVDVFASERR